MKHIIYLKQDIIVDIPYTISRQTDKADYAVKTGHFQTKQLT